MRGKKLLEILSMLALLFVVGILAFLCYAQPMIAITWSFDTILMICLLIGATSTVGLTLRISKHSFAESMTIYAVAGVFLSLTSSPHPLYVPLNIVIFSAILGIVFFEIEDIATARNAGHTIERPSYGDIAFFAALGIFIPLILTLFVQFAIAIPRGWPFRSFSDAEIIDIAVRAYYVSLFIFAFCGFFIYSMDFKKKRLCAACAVFGSIIGAFSFYILGNVGIRLGEMEQSVIVGMLCGAIAGLIPFVNILYGLIAGLIIGGYSSNFIYSLSKPFFVIVLLMVPAYIYADKIDRKYEHTVGSRAVSIVLFVLLISLSLLVADLQRFSPVGSLIFALLAWFPTNVVLLKTVERSQKLQRKMRELEKELHKLVSTLSHVEAQILIQEKEMQKLKQKHQEPFNRRNELQMEINMRVSSSSEARILDLRAKEFRKKAGSLSKIQIYERMQEIKRRTGNIMQHRRQLEKKVSAFESETEKLSSRWDEIERDLQRLVRNKDRGRAFEVELKRSRDEWKHFNKPSDFDDIVVSGEVRPLVKEQRLLEIQMEANKKEIEALRNEIRDMDRNEDLLLIEKCILEQEEITKSLGQDEPRLIEIGSELEKLKAEQTRLIEEKSRVSEILAKMRVAKPRLQVGKSIYVLLTATLIVSILLNSLSYGF